MARRSAGPSSLRAAVVAGLVLSAACTHGAPAVTPKPNARHERALAAGLDRVFGAVATQHALWGVQVKSLDSGRILYSRNAGTLMMPASNMKILTLAAAAQTLGWDFCFKTTLETDAAVENGTLNGSLFVRGTGDPTINTRNGRAEALFGEWAAALKAAGISRIQGSVIGDDDAFDDEGLGQGWSWDYLQDGYAAPVGALEFNENIAKLTVTPAAAAGADASVSIGPAAGYQLAGRVVSGEAGSQTRITVDRRASEAVLDVSGTIAAGAEPWSRDIAVVNPTLYFAQALRNALVARGIEIAGAAVDLDDVRQTIGPGPRRVLIETDSPPLRDIATVTMKVSQNLYAETLLKAVGAGASGTGTTAAGRAAAREIFTGWKIEPDSYVQADGSGLSRYDYVSAGLLVTILEHLHADVQHRDAFYATLPIAGKDGTISTRMRATRAEANAVAKTGSISNVRALSGYVRTRDGELLAFSILANNFIVPAATVNGMADQAVEALANYTRR